MYSKRISLSIPIFLLSICIFCQKVEFHYDVSGNRESRTIIVERLESGSVEFPILNPKGLMPAENMKGQASEEGEISTLVYPNPNKGLIKIDISNMPFNPTNDMRLYDLSGKQLIIKRNFESYSEIDISHFKDGTYILRIKINENLFDWKVIKNH